VASVVTVEFAIWTIPPKQDARTVPSGRSATPVAARQSVEDASVVTVESRIWNTAPLLASQATITAPSLGRNATSWHW
jgi:hypothetical protein